jgi:DNA-binding response OmpR family regulator
MDEGLGAAPKKLLIVEDDFYIRDIYKIEAKNEGFVVFEASDGEEGLSIAKVAGPDIILLDLMLPKITGIDVLKTIKSWDDFKNIPIILFTNVGDPEPQKQAMDAGAAEYLLKVEHTPREIMDILKKHLTPAT